MFFFPLLEGDEKIDSLRMRARSGTTRLSWEKAERAKNDIETRKYFCRGILTDSRLKLMFDSFEKKKKKGIESQK